MQPVAANFHQAMEFSFIAHLFFTAARSVCAQGRHPYKSAIERLSFGAFYLMNKLPQITLAFWVMKICATTLGETAGTCCR